MIKSKTGLQATQSRSAMKPVFFLKNKSKALFNSLFPLTSTTRKSHQDLHKLYTDRKTDFHSTTHFDYERMDALAQIFNQLVLDQPVFTDIQLEYCKISKVAFQMMDEKQFVQTTLRVNVSNPEKLAAIELKRQQSKDLDFQIQMLISKRNVLDNSVKREAIRFVLFISPFYDAVIADTSRRDQEFTDLVMNGRWHFLRIWISERAPLHAVFMNIFKQINYAPNLFIEAVTKSIKNLHEIQSFDSLEVKKVKMLLFV